ncbi:MAG TPA: VCBS repeat-containing protein [Saprospiraceae bacterium]|nr:VCBS repeat-containing protein [Saprospiraceae bacterium]
MNISRSLFAVITLLLCCGHFSCKKSDSSSSPASAQVTDTRILVKEAYGRANPLKILPTFSRERVPLFRDKMDKETDPGKHLNAQFEYAFELLKAGNVEDAINNYSQGMKFIMDNHIPLDSQTQRNMYTALGLCFMRQGELENCVQNHNHESCFIPIAGQGIHKYQEGSRNAIAQFEKSLQVYPNDPETRYLLNIAYQTIGEYPDKVPAKWRIPPSWFSNKYKFPRYEDVAPKLGLNRNGHAGGCIMDDFDNDGWLDLMVSSWTHDDPVIYYKNNGDGTFTDKTAQFGLDGQMGSLYIDQTDFNNDGFLDLFIIRGAWLGSEGNIPRTLLMNTGKGSFTDVTIKAGITHAAPSQACAWADFNLDGWLDLVIANESSRENNNGIDLYINQKDGTFKQENAAWGLTQNNFFKGLVAVDVNNDHYPDLYISSLASPNLLLINHGYEGKFQFAPAPSSESVSAPIRSFPCWNFDYDNDGNEDIFVAAYSNDKSPAIMWMASHEKLPESENLPKLYHNKGNLQFEEVGIKMGITEVSYTMGCNFGDINTDGFLDFYLSTGNPLYQSIVPNKMYLNIDGKRFEDVSYSGGFANIQKGHAITFGDWDRDGDEDCYAVIGGAYDGDKFYNVMFENPNPDHNNWVVLKLEGNGTTTNKMAIGAHVMVSVQEGGKERKIYRVVTSGASFGANSLQLEVGLRKATKVNQVTVSWPCQKCPDQTYTGMEINNAYKLVQGQDKPEPMTYTPTKVPEGGVDLHGHM